MEDEKREDGRLVHRRLWVLMVLLAALVCMFLFLLYDLQLVHGAELLESSQRKIPKTETVDAARGGILDSLGRVLVTNRLSYQAALDTSLMGTAAERNAVLLELLELCREQGVAWNDTLPITTQEPFAYTTDQPFFITSVDEDGNETRSLTYLGQLALKVKWIDKDPTQTVPASPETWELVVQLGRQAANLPPLVDASLPSAQELLDTMCVRLGLIEKEAHADAIARAAAGVLYELNLRSWDVNRNSYIFAEEVDIGFISAVKEHGLPGVNFNTVTLRQYNTSYAAHLLGRVTMIERDDWPYYRDLGYPMDAVVGKGGAEQAFEKYLRGTAGVRIVETTTSGKTVTGTWQTNSATGEALTPQPGDNVVLTLNIRLQEMVERSLADAVASLPEAEKGAAVVIDVNTGGVLAMASCPTYDLANFYAVWDEIKDDPNAPMYNRALFGMYAPGSTFKMVVAAGALEEGIITTTDKILDTGAYTYYTNDINLAPKCWIYRQYGGTHGQENVTDAIRDSCNVFFYDVGRRLGIAKINEYAHMFGLGDSTGIELAENTGVVAGPDYTEGVLGQIWYEGATLSAAIGQENNQFTPLQLANYIAALVNGGNHYSAHLLKEVKSADFSQVVYEREPELLDTIEIKPEHLEAIKQGMLEVTTGTGTAAQYFKDVDVQVGAKSGTAQVAADSEANAVFVAFAPYEEPEIAICIVVEKGGSGSELGAAAADIISFYFGSEVSLEAGQGENTLIR